MSTIRDAGTAPSEFRAALGELTRMLVYEAARDLAVRAVRLRTPVAETSGVQVANTPLMVPVLRAGLGMVDAALELLPQAQVGFVGLARDESTLQPSAYLESLPESLAGREVYLLDPMLATGGSLLRAIELVRSRGAGPITCVCVLAAPEGVRAIEQSGQAGMELRLVTASIDERLNENGFIVPGLGDAGDRQFVAV
ncbi:MAG: uracil phosphoribosyltransferase [Cumulibacter sp.]